jgi:hypothetical protein
MLAHDHSPDYTILYYCPDVASLLYSNRGNRCFNIVRPLALEFGLLCMVRQPTHVIWVARHKVTRPQTILKFRPPSSLDYRTRHGSQSGCDGVWVRWDGWAIVASFSWVCICGRCCCCCCCWWLVGDVGGAVYVGLGWGCWVVWGSGWVWGLSWHPSVAIEHSKVCTILCDFGVWTPNFYIKMKFCQIALFSTQVRRLVWQNENWLAGWCHRFRSLLWV